MTGAVDCGGDAGEFAIHFQAGPVRLRFSRFQFYQFVVLVLEAEGPHRQHRLAGHHSEDIRDHDIEFSSMADFGRVYECPTCSFIHVDVAGQRVMVVPSRFCSFVELVRLSAIEAEEWVSQRVARMEGLAGSA